MFDQRAAFIDTGNRLFEHVTVNGFPRAPDGTPCRCHVDLSSQKIEVSDTVPLDDREALVCAAIEDATGVKVSRLVPFVGSVRADGQSA